MLRIIILILFSLIVRNNFIVAQSYQWNQTSCPLSAFRFNDISIIENNAWVVGFIGDLYTTKDNGLTWDSLEGPPSTVYRSVLFLDSLNGFIGCLGSISPDSTIIYSTTDGGNSWNNVNLPMPFGDSIYGGICGMCKVEDSVIYTSGAYYGHPHIYKSTDSGQHWQSYNLSNQAFSLVDIYFWSKDSGIVVGSTGPNLTNANAAIFKTNDGGQNWQIVYQSQMLHEWCWKISVANPGTFFVSVEQNSIGPRYCLKSNDYGNSWNEIQYSTSTSSAPNIVSQGIGFRTVQEGWVGINYTNAVNGTMFHTINGGASWALDSIDFGLNRFRFLNDSTGFAVGGYVFKMNSSVVEVKTISPKLFTIYPSISKECINLFFTNESEKSLRIFSSDGKLIYDKRFSDNHYIVDMSLFVAGVYYIIATSDKQYSSDKFVLLKL
jgi:photosystem II stability/assembly factor-like uncharacterized protein